MFSIKIKNLKKAEDALIGMPIPFGLDNAKVATLIEETIADSGYTMNPGAGCDIQGIAPNTDIEVKAREIGAQSARQIGSMTYTDIINTSWHDSPLKKKFQQQFIVYWCKQRMMVTSASMYDFTIPAIQKIMEEAYEQTRDIFILRNYPGAFDDEDTKANDVFGKYVRGIKDDGSPSDAYFEHKASNSWEFRFTDSMVKKLEDISKASGNNLFDYGD